MENFIITNELINKGQKILESAWHQRDGFESTVHYSEPVCAYHNVTNGNMMIIDNRHYQYKRYYDYKRKKLYWSFN